MKPTHALTLFAFVLTAGVAGAQTQDSSKKPLEPIPEETFLQRINRLEALLEKQAVRRRRPGRTPSGHRYRTVRPKMADAILAEQLAKDLCLPDPKIERRRYPRQPLKGLDKLPKTLPFAAKETILDFGDGLKVRRLSFPNAQVAKDWAGGEVARGYPGQPTDNAPRVIEVRGDAAVVLEGDKALDSPVAAHALRSAWEHEPTPGASKQPTELFAVDNGKGKVARAAENRVLRAQIFPRAPLQKDLPAGFPVFEVGGLQGPEFDAALQKLHSLAPSSIHRHDLPKPTLAETPPAPPAPPVIGNERGAKDAVEELLGETKQAK